MPRLGLVIRASDPGSCNRDKESGGWGAGVVALSVQQRETMPPWAPPSPLARVQKAVAWQRPLFGNPLATEAAPGGSPPGEQGSGHSRR